MISKLVYLIIHPKEMNRRGYTFNMRFIKFAIGALLIVGATIVLCLLFTIGLVPAVFGGGSGLLGWLIFLVIVVIAYAGGVWLVRKNRP
jgi:hypothetical protein